MSLNSGGMDDIIIKIRIIEDTDNDKILTNYEKRIKKFERNLKNRGKANQFNPFKDMEKSLENIEKMQQKIKLDGRDGRDGADGKGSNGDDDGRNKLLQALKALKKAMDKMNDVFDVDALRNLPSNSKDKDKDMVKYLKRIADNSSKQLRNRLTGGKDNENDVLSRLMNPSETYRLNSRGKLNPITWGKAKFKDEDIDYADNFKGRATKLKDDYKNMRNYQKISNDLFNFIEILSRGRTDYVKDLNDTDRKIINTYLKGLKESNKGIKKVEDELKRLESQRRRLGENDYYRQESERIKKVNKQMEDLDNFMRLTIQNLNRYAKDDVSKDLAKYINLSSGNKSKVDVDTYKDENDRDVKVIKVKYDVDTDNLKRSLFNFTDKITKGINTFGKNHRSSLNMFGKGLAGTTKIFDKTIFASFRTMGSLLESMDTMLLSGIGRSLSSIGFSAKGLTDSIERSGGKLGDVMANFGGKGGKGGMVGTVMEVLGIILKISGTLFALGGTVAGLQVLAVGIGGILGSILTTLVSIVNVIGVKMIAAVGSLTGALGGVGIVALTLMPAFGKVSEYLQQKADIQNDLIALQEELNKQIALGNVAEVQAVREKIKERQEDLAHIREHNSEILKLADSLESFKSRFKEFISPFQQGMFDGVATLFDGLIISLEKLSPAFSGVTSSFNSLMASFTNSASNGNMDSLFNFANNNFASSMEAWLESLGNFALGIFGIFNAFQPQITSFETSMLNSSLAFKNWGETLSSSGGFQNFLGWLEKTKPLVNDLWQSIKELVKNVWTEFGGKAEDILPGLTSVIDWIGTDGVDNLGMLTDKFIYMVDEFKGSKFAEFLSDAFGWFFDEDNLQATIDSFLGFLDDATPLFELLWGIVKVAYYFAMGIFDTIGDIGKKLGSLFDWFENSTLGKLVAGKLDLGSISSAIDFIGGFSGTNTFGAATWLTSGLLNTVDSGYNSINNLKASYGTPNTSSSINRGSYTTNNGSSNTTTINMTNNVRNDSDLNKIIKSTSGYLNKNNQNNLRNLGIR